MVDLLSGITHGLTFTGHIVYFRLAFCVCFGCLDKVEIWEMSCWYTLCERKLNECVGAMKRGLIRSLAQN
jgi:hypothetical protein